ncbi:WDdomain 35 [Angomonas deanei]|nr:WDdomain 35 [Angomonas deanei]|eukprot:EPY32487.1 WDdomain 35 [Angomonas deanei]
MFVYLSKRIAIPNGIVLSSIGWNEEQGWLACGGENGLLKVLKVDGGSQGQKTGGLSINQTLEGHDSNVHLIAWNQQYMKLTSGDENGHIIVWSLHKGMWMEEMLNNREKSRVVDLSWSVEGTRICIAYEDGAVIVGDVDGNRLWGKEYDFNLAKVTWTPDDRHIVFGSAKGEVFIHNVETGNMVSQVNIYCVEGEAKLSGLQWHPAWVERANPPAAFAICYQVGELQLMNSIGDDNPFLVEIGIPVSHISWNPQGTVLAVCGVSATPNSPDSSVVIIQFFDNEGQHLRKLRVAGKKCGGVTWEGDGLRVAVAVDSSIYFANVRPEYKFSYFKHTLVYSYTKPEKAEDSVMLWNINTNARTVKSVAGLIYLQACEDACVIVNRDEEVLRQTVVQLVNTIGSPLGTKYIDLEPYACGMNSSHVVCCGEENVYVWQFRDPKATADALDPISVQASRDVSKERIFHIDEIVSPESQPQMKVRSALTSDLICAVCVSEEYLFIARESGTLHIFSFQPFQLVAKYILASRAQSMAANSDSTFLSIIDFGGVLNAFPIEKSKFSLSARKVEPVQNFERKDVWDQKWATDDPSLLAVMEKTKMVVFRNFEGETPIQTFTSICKFQSLRVRSVQFDELMQDPDRPRREQVVDHPSSALTEFNSLLEEASMKELYEYSDQKGNRKLWKLLAEHALTKLDFTYAEMAFIRLQDYPSLQFVKRVRALDDPRKQNAEVHAYYSRFEEAEAIYKEMDRKDLALELRYRMGDWFGVVRLVQEGGGDESLMRTAWENIGDQYADRQKWTKAIQYYTQCRHYQKLARLFFIIEDFEMLTQLIDMAEHDKELLLTLGSMFLTAGLAEEASEAFIAAGEPRRAVDGCVQLNMWDKAVVLAEKYKQDDIEKLFQKYASYLIKQDRLPEAIELHRKAGQNDEAAKLLAQLGQQASETDPLRAKKYYVLSALQVETYRKKKVTLAREGAEVVEEMLQSDQTAVSERTLDAAWRGAEAYHFYLQCQKQIVDNNLKVALVLAMRLMEYDDLIAPVDSYSLIALTAYLAGNFGLCSKAFSRLEAAEMNDAAGADGLLAAPLANFSMDLDLTSTQKTMGSTALSATSAVGTNLSATSTALQLTNTAGKGAGTVEFTYPTVSLSEPVRRFADLAIKIFTKHKPVDNSVDSIGCPDCGTFNKEWAANCVKCQHKFGVCLVTGRCIVNEEDAWICAVCRHKALDTAVDTYKNCPLCHSPKKQRTRRGA